MQGEQRAYILEFLGPSGAVLRSDEADVAAQVLALYGAASANGLRHMPDPLADVEAQLGISGSDSTAGPTSQ
jgi:hypothetical protein